MIVYIKTFAKDEAFAYSKSLDFAGVIVDFNKNDEVIGIEILGAEELTKYDSYGNNPVVMREDESE